MQDSAYSDFDMIGDFIRLNIIINRDSTTLKDKQDSLELQGVLLQLMQVTENNEILFYNLLHDVYISNVRYINELSGSHEAKKITTHELDEESDRDNNFMILFHNPDCSACRETMPVWNEFKAKSNETSRKIIILEFEDNDHNSKVFEYFKIQYVPTIIKLQLDKKKYATLFNDDINISNLLKFSQF